MLNAMRENAGSWIIKVLLGIIVVAFIFMGAGSFNAKRASKVATVNGDAITVNQYQQAYYNVLENLRAQFGNRLNDDMIKMFNVKQQALDGLIDTTLLRQSAEKNGLRVPDAELAQSIIRIPAFQKNGAFDKQRYKILLGQNRLTPESFETMQKEAILMDRLRSFITKNAKVSELEVREWYNWENTSVDINYVAFKPDAFKDVEITDQMLEDYYTAHKEEYKTEPMVQARYVKFDPEAYKATANVTSDEIQQYYAEQQDEFKLPETVSARHILFKVQENADAKAVEDARLKAGEIMEKAKSGEDFAELAKTYSEGPSKENGGQLGAFKREEMVKPFSDTAFSMAIGDISEPVRTQFGWHIIKVETHNQASTMSLEEATPQITEKQADRKAKNIAYDAAVSLYDITFDGEEFVKNSKDSGLELVTSDLFTIKKGPKGVGNASAFAETAFKLPMMELSDITEIGESYYLIQIIHKEPEKIPEFDAVKEEVTKDTKQAQQKIAAEDAAKKFLEKAKAAGSIADAAEDDTSIKIQSTGQMNRNASVPGIGNDRKLMAAVFKLTENNKLPENVVKAETGLYVIELRDKKLPLEQGLNIAKSNIHDRMLSQKQSALYSSWVANLRENSEITIAKDFINN
ncbi:MAG: peptidyl-prolyl cis-trans isomerase [Desulfobacteraceae bacterium]|nr:SurA N-terminal domain-containing protein [Desulfobacteraceae bacterium]MBC2756219.1 peptidyl-prolyl cis-trans isomerase [Desulfobacteraceae bacterium]